MKRILNESKEGWKMVEEETNPCALITLMVSWIDCLMVRYIILNNTMQYNNFLKWFQHLASKPLGITLRQPFSAANLPCSAPLTLDNSRDR